MNLSEICNWSSVLVKCNRICPLASSPKWYDSIVYYAWSDNEISVIAMAELLSQHMIVGLFRTFFKLNSICLSQKASNNASTEAYQASVGDRAVNFLFFYDQVISFIPKKHTCTCTLAII